MGGIILDQALPSSSTDQLDPFLLLHHWKSNFPEGESVKDHGVGPHPHRGFSPVTFIFEGSVLHQDSRGNVSEVHKNGIQWMNAGLGVVHSERPAPSFLKKGGPYELIQLWINTPASAKMNQPKYIPLQASDIPSVSVSDKGGVVRVVAGEHLGAKGKIIPESAMDIFSLELKKDEMVELHSDSSFNTMMYIVEGGVKLNNEKTAFTKDLVIFETDGSEIHLKATADTKLVYLSGKPLEEPMVSHGPFVMNSETEIMQAMRDHQIGKMGILVEEFE